MQSKKIKIKNAHIITPHRIIRNGQLLIEEGRIVDFGETELEVTDARIIDAKGLYLAPGFVDIHVHGGGGCDFMDNTVEAYQTIAKTHARFGTTAMVPTTLTSGKGELLKTLAIFDQVKLQQPMGAKFIGMHIEGPYFSMNQRGAQDPRYIRDPDPVEYTEILDSSSAIIRWSAAPERKGAIAFGSLLRRRGILPSIAHTDAVYDDVIKAYEEGYTLATHLYSAMSGVTRKQAFRFGGVVESAFLLTGMDVEIIADGKHLPPELLKLVVKIKGIERTALITDAMRGAAMPEGKSILGNLHNGMEVLIEDGVAKLPDKSGFAGSVATCDLLVRNMMRLADVSLQDAVHMMTLTPARIIGIDGQTGSIAVGKDADLVLFDEEIAVKKTFVSGNVVYDGQVNKLIDL
ncbi:N-acetylglucosamine-6-phosphate deacetylase [Olivibacter ginsenosidimutans]|uniref:N-acetylglucosamine-6-phosphate deacetylase n=1 Tax=Olivibacter ginsenosidimutans TaxID=1176537 RepID=A0ABP9AW10_9SPHI